MNKQNNKLTLSVLAMLTAAIGLIYTLIMYHDIVFAVIGMSILFLITVFVLTQNLITFSTIKNKSLNVQIKSSIDDISTQLEAINGAQSQIGKATYLYTRQAAQAVSTLENNYRESQEALYKNLAILSNTQNKAAKLMIKYEQSNATKIIANVKDMSNKLSDTMIHGFDQIHPDNAEIVTILNEIIIYLKNQPAGMDESLELRLNNIAHELQNISNSIWQIQLLQQNAAQAAAVTSPLTEAKPATNTTSIEEPGTVIHSIEPEESVSKTDTNPTENSTLMEDVTATSEPVPEKRTEDSKPADITEEVPFTPTFTVVRKSDHENIDITEINEPETNKSTSTIGDINTDSDKQLSADEIAALFAAADPSPNKSRKPAAVDNIEKKPSTEKQDNIEPMSENPNKQLSPDEIAALFAAAEPAPKKPVSPEIPVAETISEPVSDDPNKQLSPDEIAALFASLG